MSEVTYFVALPFVATDDGAAAGESMECFNPVAVVLKRFRARRATSARLRLAAMATPPLGRQGDQEVRRSAGWI